MVKTVDILAAEYKLVEFEQVVSVFINIDLQSAVERVYSQFVVVRECYDIVSKPFVEFIYFAGPVFALVQRAFDSGVNVEIRFFPAVCGVDVAVWVEYVRAVEWFWLGEIVYWTYARGGNNTERNEHNCG